MKVVLVDNFFGDVGDVEAHVFTFFDGCSQVEVEMALFQRIFDVVRSAVCVDTSPS
jgi:hypothetical protein